jgi:hypothetical protein
MRRKKLRKEYADFKRKVRCCCGNLYITMRCTKSKVMAISADLRSSDECKRSCGAAIVALVNLILRKEKKSEEIIQELKGIRCYEVVSEGKIVPSCAQAIAGLLDRYR